MAWCDTLGTLLLWTGFLCDESLELAIWQAYYNGYIFETLPVIEWKYNNNNYTTDTYGTINTNWQKYRQSKKTPKTYTIQWYLLEADCVSLEQEIDKMTKACSQHNKQFKYKRRDGTTLFANASIQLEFGERFDTTFFIPYTATVTVFDGSMYGSVMTEQSRLNTVSNITSIVSYDEGNEQWLPYITITWKAWCSITWIVLSLWEYTLDIPVTLSDTDVLLINTRGGYIWKNLSQSISWNGELPLLEIWSNTFNVYFTGTPNVDVYLMSYPTYA